MAYEIGIIWRRLRNRTAAASRVLRETVEALAIVGEAVTSPGLAKTRPDTKGGRARTHASPKTSL